MVQTIFLTGASGLLGQALLPQLRAFRVICLGSRRPLSNDQITVVAGDICKPQLGLDMALYQEIANQVDWIIHAAAITDFACPPDALRACNVTGVRTMLAFAKAANAPLLHVSTAFVQPRQGHRFNAYERSKRAAERVIRQSGLPVTVVRPSIIVGDAATGVIGKQQGIHRVMRLLLDGLLPAVPGFPETRIDFVPQDRVAAAIVGLIRHGIVGRDYWLTAGDKALPLADGLAILAAHRSQQLQRVVGPPRLASPTAVAAMLRQPAQLPLTEAERQRVEESLELFNYTTQGSGFASSFAQLGEQMALDPLPDPHETFQRNVDYLVRYQQGNG